MGKELANSYDVICIYATSSLKPVMALASVSASPARWMLVGLSPIGSIHFLSYGDMARFIRSRNLKVWTKDIERKAKIKLSNEVPMLYASRGSQISVARSFGNGADLSRTKREVQTRH